MARFTPEFEIDRMSHRLIDESGILIQDRDSFDYAFNQLIGISNDSELTAGQHKFRDQVFSSVLSLKPDTRPDRLFKKARGKDLKKDRKTTETILKTDKDFIKKGAKRFDFAGFDIKESEINKKSIRSRKELAVPASIKGKVVITTKEFIKVLGKEQVRYRDSKGRFASIRK